MINEEIKSFVKGALSKGEPKEKIRAELLANGWNQNDVNEVFNAIANGPAGPLYDIPKYSSKDMYGMGKLLTFVSILLVIGAGGFTAYKSGYLDRFLNRQSPTIAENPLTTAESSETTAGWKTYMNLEYGFEFKYPSDLIINEARGTDSQGVEYLNIYVKTKEFIEAENFCTDCGVALPPVVVSRLVVPDNVIKNYLTECDKNEESSSVVVSGISSKKCVLKETMNGPWVGILLDAGDNIYYRLQGEGYETEYNKNIFDQVFSTFKFINNKTVEAHTISVSSSWKTYTNTEWGIEFKYPNDWQAVFCEGYLPLYFNHSCASPYTLTSTIAPTEADGYKYILAFYGPGFLHPIKREDISIDGKDAKLFTWTVTEESAGEVYKQLIGHTIKAVTFVHKDLAFVIIIRENDFEEFDHILSTFKFIY